MNLLLEHEHICFTMWTRGASPTPMLSEYYQLETCVHMWQSALCVRE